MDDFKSDIERSLIAADKIEKEINAIRKVQYLMNDVRRKLKNVISYGLRLEARHTDPALRKALQASGEYKRFEVWLESKAEILESVKVIERCYKGMVDPKKGFEADIHRSAN